MKEGLNDRQNHLVRVCKPCLWNLTHLVGRPACGMGRRSEVRAIHKVSHDPAMACMRLTDHVSNVSICKTVRCFYSLSSDPASDSIFPKSSHRIVGMLTRWNLGCIGSRDVFAAVDANIDTVLLQPSGVCRCGRKQSWPLNNDRESDEECVDDRISSAAQQLN